MSDCVLGTSGSSRAEAGHGASSVPGREVAGRPAKCLLSTVSPGRLSSLRCRDLTLGGIKKPKRSFEPNVNAVRRSKDELKEEVTVVPNERRSRGERSREGRGRRRRKSQTIQSHSIFEQGPSDSLHKTGWRGAMGQCDPPTSPLRRDVLKEDRGWRGQEEDEEEEEILSKLQRDDFLEDPGLKSDDRLRPIQLPLSSRTACKEEPSCRLPGGGAAPGTGPPRHSRLGELFRELRVSGREELFLMQLPDCMPVRTSPEKRPAQQPPAALLRDNRPLLSQFSEGMLGKLLVRKSGKVQLKMGDIVMDVTDGAAFSFLQSLACVRLAEGRRGDLAVLGSMQHKLVVAPDFQALLQDAAREAPAPRGPLAGPAGPLAD